MKKYLKILLCLALAICLISTFAACGDDTVDEPDGTENSVVDTSDNGSDDGVDENTDDNGGNTGDNGNGGNGGSGDSGNTDGGNTDGGNTNTDKSWENGGDLGGGYEELYPS